MSAVPQTLGKCSACGFGPIWIAEIETNGKRFCKLCLTTYVAHASVDASSEVLVIRRQINHVANALMAQIGQIAARVGALESMVSPSVDPSACANPECGHDRRAHNGGGMCAAATNGPGGICQCDGFVEAES